MPRGIYEETRSILLRNLLGSRIPLSIRVEILPYILNEELTGHITGVKEKKDV